MGSEKEREEQESGLGEAWVRSVAGRFTDISPSLGHVSNESVCPFLNSPKPLNFFFFFLLKISP